MGNSIKRFLALALAVFMVIGMMPTNIAFAEETHEHTYGEDNVCTVEGCEETKPAEGEDETPAPSGEAQDLDAGLDTAAEGGEDLATYVAKIGENGYATFAEALTAASAMTGDVVVEVYDKVTLNAALSGSYDSIKFVGKDADAEIYLDVQGYITATGKKVAFENLTLSKSVGGHVANAGFMNVAFGVYDVVSVDYTNCVFANGACASSGVVTFTGCTFKRSHDKYGLWAYGNVNVTVNGCTFADYRGIKMYAEGAAKTVDLTVKNTNFSAVDNKPAIVLTYGESVTLEGNTYSSTGVFELDLGGDPNGTTVTSDVAPTCVNDNGACGVLVDGKIYTTVAQAAAVATSGSAVTLLHNSTETVELPEGVTLNKNGFEATGVTVKTPVYVAKIGEQEFTSLQAAINAAEPTDTITVLADVTEEITTLKGKIVSGVEGGVTITGTYDDWVYAANNFTIGEGVTFKTPALFLYCGDAVIEGEVVVDSYYQRYAGSKLTINEPGSMTVTSETFILRYMDGDPNAGIYIVGDKDDATVGLNLAVAFFYQGMINAKDANIKVGTYWQTNETDGQGTANLVLDNSKLSVTTSEHNFKATGNSTVTLTNGSQVTVAGGHEFGANAVISADSTSSFKDMNGEVTVGITPIVEPVAKVGEAEYATLAEALTAANDGDIITLIWAEGDAPIAMNGAVYGKTVTITGTATVDWSKGFLFVGRGGEGDGTVIFDNANLTSASNSASYGIHVSGREKNTNNKYNGTLEINNSTIVLDYLINKGVMTLDNATLTVKNGFAIGGRPASETESGEDATATLNLTNGSKVVVNSHNGMGLGYEAIGVMNIDATSSFETTQSFLVTAKGTMNLAGTATITGTLTNNGSIVLTDAAAKLTSSECGNVTCLEGYVVDYKDGAYIADKVVKHLTINVGSAVATMALVEKVIDVATMDEAVAKAKEAGADYVTYKIYGAVELTTGGSHGILDLGENVVIEGVTGDAKLTIVGGGVPDIKGVTFKNITIADEGTYEPTANEFMYQNFIDCSFENVTFEEGIRVSGDTIITNSTIKADKVNQYAVWSDGGKLTMTGTKVTVGAEGYGMVKSDAADAEFVLTGNTFKYLGEANKEVLNTKGATITAANNEFIDCSKGIIPADKTNYAADSTELTEAALTANNTVQSSVAQIGATKYATLAAAINAATAGDKITFLTDITGDVTVNKSLTIDGAGKYYTGNISVEGSTVAVTVKNVKFVNGTGYAVTTNRIKSITVENCTVKDYGYGFLYANKSTPTVVVKNVDVENCNYGVHWVYGSNATLENLTTTNVKYGLYVQNYAAKTVTLKNCNITTISIWEREGYSAVQTFKFEGANTVGTLTDSEYAKYVLAAEGATLTAPEGAKVTTSVEGKIVAYKDGVYQVAAPVAKIGEQGYATIADAIAAVGAGDVVIELLADATLDYNARDAYGTAETTSLTINGNGHTLTLNQKNSDWASLGLANADAKLVLNNMTVEKTGYGDTSGAWNTHAIIFSCNVEMNNVTVKNGIAVQNGATLNNVTINEANGYYGLWINGNGQTVTVTGGEINATNGGRGIKIADQYIDTPASVNLTVTDTVFNTAKKAAVLVSSTAGAKITASNVDITKVAADSVNFAWVDEDWAANYGNVTVNNEPAAQEAIETFVAAIMDGEKVAGYYKTLAAAIEAAETGATITLLADITEDVTVSKGVTIDGAGKTYTGKMTLTNKADITIKNVNFDGKGYNGYAVQGNGAYYVTIEDCTAKNYGYGFVQMASGSVQITVKNVTVSDMNYGVKIDYGTAVVLENVDITAGVAAVLNSNYGEKTITIKNSELNILGTWTRNDTTKTNIVFEGENSIAQFKTDAAIDNFKLAVGATLTAPNEITATATEAGYSVKYEDGTYGVVEQKLFNIQTSNIVLGNELAMYFYVKNTDLNGEDYIAVVTKTYADGTEDVVVQIPYSEWEDTTNDRKRFKFNGIAAKEMGDDIYVVIQNSEGAILTEVYTDSIQKYVERGFNTGNAQKNSKLATLLVDMLNYGAAAQGIFNYNTENPANKNMADYQNYATQSVNLTNNQVKGMGFRSMSAVLESNISLVMFFEKDYVDQTMTAVVTFRDHYGVDHELKIDGSKFEDRGSKGWAVIVNELVVADGCQLVTCKFLDADGNELEGIYGIDSLEGMCARAVAGGGGSYYEDIMKFSIAAYNYFR